MTGPVVWQPVVTGPVPAAGVLRIVAGRRPAGVPRPHPQEERNGCRRDRTDRSGGPSGGRSAGCREGMGGEAASN
ncbi:hypothetical protein GCM10025734_08230 [Kitasatospora paranensis]